eukprot:576952-Hanusia_phi.AAC.2
MAGVGWGGGTRGGGGGGSVLIRLIRGSKGWESTSGGGGDTSRGGFQTILPHEHHGGAWDGREGWSHIRRKARKMKSAAEAQEGAMKEGREKIASPRCSQAES